MENPIITPDELAGLFMVLDLEGREIGSLDDVISLLRAAGDSPLTAVLVMKILKHDACNDALRRILLNKLHGANRVVALSYLLSDPAILSEELLHFIQCRFTGTDVGEYAAAMLKVSKEKKVRCRPVEDPVRDSHQAYLDSGIREAVGTFQMPPQRGLHI